MVDFGIQLSDGKYELEVLSEDIVRFSVEIMGEKITLKLHAVKLDSFEFMYIN